jgi:predicted dehydrogenase
MEALFTPMFWENDMIVIKINPVAMATFLMCFSFQFAIYRDCRESILTVLVPFRYHPAILHNFLPEYDTLAIFTKYSHMDRRKFVRNSALITAGSIIATPWAANAFHGIGKKRLAMVGTGIRGTDFWGKTVLKNYTKLVDFVGLCDTNIGRVNYAKKAMEVSCPVYTDLSKMITETKPEIVIVTTRDDQHDLQIVEALEAGCNVITEKPMTTDEVKCKRILDAEKRTGKKVIVGFNYRYMPHATKLKELLTNNRVGDITSVDFNWYLNTYHGADYFRRWHAYTKYGGSLWVHKATHHFDLLNWWLNSDPVEVMAYGNLENYGKNGIVRGTSCRSCAHKTNCKFYWDMTKNQKLMDLYAANEQYDGYVRDSCVFREDIDIWDKMSAQIKYANGILVNYSLTTYSPYEGWRIAFNGKNGRLDSWQDIPYQSGTMDKISQDERHALEMSQDKDKPTGFEEIIISDNFKPGYESVKLPKYSGGHGGGDKRMQDYIFQNPDMDDPYKLQAGTRDGAFSILIGIAARKSIAENRPVKITELTDLVPKAVRPV